MARYLKFDYDCFDEENTLKYLRLGNDIVIYGIPEY